MFPGSGALPGFGAGILKMWAFWQQEISCASFYGNKVKIHAWLVGYMINALFVGYVEVQGFKPLGYLSLLPQAGVSLYDWIAPAIVYIV